MLRYLIFMTNDESLTKNLVNTLINFSVVYNIICIIYKIIQNKINAKVYYLQSMQWLYIIICSVSQ